MKQQLLGRIFIVLPAVLCLSIVSMGNAFAADPVTIRYEVTSHQTSLGFVLCHNEDGPRTELLSDGTTAWSYQFATANPEQLISVYPAPVDNPNAAILVVSKVYLNNVLYRTATGQNAAAAGITDTLNNLLATGPAHQWAISYEVTAEQTTLGLVTYSNNHTLGQSEILAAGTTAWHYQYIAANSDQPVKIEAVPGVTNDPDKFYAVMIKVFVNNNLRYSATFGPHSQPVIDVKLGDLLAGQTQPAWQPPAENLGLQVIPGIAPTPIMEASVKSLDPAQTTPVFNPDQLFGNPNQIHTTGFSFFTNDRYVYLTFGSGPQPPKIEEPSSILLASVPARY